jgi:multiple sugar transport system ATP-binding protein
MPSNLSAKIGDTVGLSFRSERLALFDARSGSAIATASHGVDGHG